MNTPIADFVRGYEKQNMARFHMPGHKGKDYLGCEKYDITEVAGADSLYEADGIIAESEANATMLFGTGKTLYSTEGASQCIRAMLYLLMTMPHAKGRKTVVATRNAHKSFLYAAAVLDLEVVWLYSEKWSSLCSCHVSAETLNETLQRLEEPPIAVYITSPDYLGELADIKNFAEVCHKNHTFLAVDNAHGAYFHFMNPKQHPIDLGADICCDSAHKTLPVLTGGAYLQISKNAPSCFFENAKQAMALFGSTSPSYLTLSSLDLCNFYLSDGYEEKLSKTIDKIETVRGKIEQAGWKLKNTEPLKITICAPKGNSGIEIAENLRKHGIECEYADSEYLVCMITPENVDDLERLEIVLGENTLPYEQNLLAENCICEQAMSIREAVFSSHETVMAEESIGRVCGLATVSCPPAIPIVVSGERINEKAIELFAHYGITYVDVVKEKDE